MEEIISAAATIDGAKIQANAALLGALLGFLGVVLTLIVTWLTVLKSGKVSRLAELRRQVYLETVENYALMISELITFSKDPLQLKDNLLFKIEKFESSLNKTMFVCRTETKQAIVEFYEIFVPELKELSKDIFKYIDSYQELMVERDRHDEIMQQFQKFYKLIDDLRVENPQSDKFENIFNILDYKVEDSAKAIKKIEVKEEKYNTMNESIAKSVAIFVERINEKSFDVMYLLRKEINIKSNINLDRRLNLRLKNIK